MWTSNWRQEIHVDEEHLHIVVKAHADKQVPELLVKARPAGLYKKQDDGSVRLITPDVWSAAPVAFWGWGRRWNSGIWRGTFGAEFCYG